MKKPKAKTKVHRAVTHVKAKVKHPKAKTAHEKVSHKPVARKRAWTPDGDVACCSARAVAESLRLATGRILADADVLALHRAAGGDRDDGAAILDVLRAAQASGVATLAFDRAGTESAAVFRSRGLSAELASAWEGERSRGSIPRLDVCASSSVGERSLSDFLILGLELPWGEPHAVTYNPADGTWWSWGQPMSPADFPGAVIEEAWQVTWA